MVVSHRMLVGYLSSIVFVLVVSSSSADIVTDFDDGTLQGWTTINSPQSGLPFGGELVVMPTGGNPGGFLRTEDTVVAGGSLFVAGPASYRGDLSVFTELCWDEYLYDNPPVLRSTSAWLLGPDDAKFKNRVSASVLNQWQTRSVPLVSAEWEHDSGTLSFEEVLADATVVIEVGVSGASSGYESGVDNITLVPEPATLSLLAIGVLAGFRVRKTD